MVLLEEAGLIEHDHALGLPEVPGAAGVEPITRRRSAPRGSVAQALGPVGHGLSGVLGELPSVATLAARQTPQVPARE